MERKLAAIMAADIVGYSLLMAENEASTYAELRTVFDDLIDPTIARHGGRTFKTTGDGFLAMFPSVNEAVDAALAIQQGFDDGPFELRIGINLGDVIEDNGDMYGDGVNVAARLEAMADPGSIFVSGAVVMAADRNRGDVFARVGRRRAKNIPELLNVYRVRRAAFPVVSLAATPTRSARHRCALVLRCRRRSPRPYRHPNPAPSPGGDGQPYPGRAVPEPDPRGPKAVRCGDAVRYHEWRRRPVLLCRRSDGGCDHGAGPEFRTSGHRARLHLCRTRAGQRCAEAGEKLGVSYVVEGSARREGDRLRVVAQLIDVKTGAHLWSRSFDRQVADVFTVQSELTTEIVAQLAPYIGKSEAAAAAQRPTDNLQAYDLVLQARARYRHGAQDAKGLLEARGLYQRALEMDPAYAAARAGLAMTYIADVAQRLSGQATAHELDIGLSEARQAVRLDPNLALGYQVISFGLALQADYAGALQAAKRAVELNPNDPDSMMALAKAQVRFGDYVEAVSNAERARRLHPMAPEYYAYVHGQALYAADRRDESATVIAECLVRAPRDANCLLIQAALQGGRGEIRSGAVDHGEAGRGSSDFFIGSRARLSPVWRQAADGPVLEGPGASEGPGDCVSNIVYSLNSMR